MKHYEFEISLFVEDELPPHKKEELFLHLSSCKKCSKVLMDYQKIKNNISDFYETLPSRSIYITPTPNKKNFIRRAVSRKILIPVSISVLIFVSIIFFIVPGLHQPEIKSVTNVRKEVSERALSNGKIISNSKREEKIKQVAVDYLNIKDFNDNAIPLKEKVDRELRDASYNYEFLEFNKFTNTAFYNNYN